MTKLEKAVVDRARALVEMLGDSDLVGDEIDELSEALAALDEQTELDRLAAKGERAKK